MIIRDCMEKWWDSGLFYFIICLNKIVKKQSVIDRAKRLYFCAQQQEVTVSVFNIGTLFSPGVIVVHIY